MIINTQISGGGGGGGGAHYEISGNGRRMAAEGSTVICKTPTASPGKSGYTATVTSGGVTIFSQSGLNANAEFEFTMPAGDVTVSVTA